MDEVLDRLRVALFQAYDVRSLIGRGGMATVYFAQQRAPKRDVAIKVLDGRVATRILHERFRREIDLCSRLQHPSVVPILDSGEVNGLVFYVMPYMSGESLGDRLEREGKLAVVDALAMAREVALGLHSAHQLGVVHRDIKPANILFLEGRAVVADFGVAAIKVSWDERLTKPGEVLGTPVYMSPEQAMGNWKLDGRSDIDSLGCVLYESLAGEPPFKASRPDAAIVRRITEPAPQIRKVREEVSKQVEVALIKALDWKPANRFATAVEFADALAVDPA